MKEADTLFAPATAPGRSGVAILRVSGPAARAALEALTLPSLLPLPRVAARRRFHDPESGMILDHGLALWFPGPNSFTGEDVAEFHAHGSRAVLQGLMRALGHVPGCRLAEPGEFARRAFDNGKMDLTEVEALADLIGAETEAQRRQALRQMEGAMGRLCADWTGHLTQMLAHHEAAIDFPDEDIPSDLAERHRAGIATLRDEIRALLDDARRGERLREGFNLVLLGPPNAGKSSLLNALARRDAAIVSPTAGTTRDLIDVALDLRGWPVTLTDTAGLRASADALEGEGIARARARAERADMKLLVFDGELWPERDAATAALADADSLVLVNKADLLAPALRDAAPDGVFFVSARTGEGLDALLERLGALLEARFAGIGDAVVTRARHRAALEACAAHLDRALAAPLAELRAEDLRLARREIGHLTGQTGVEAILDSIFREFCLGK